MNGQRIGYVRVSTTDQNLARQLADVEGLDRVFSDKCSGKDRNRPALTECLAYLREGDELHVHSMDRLARDVIDLVKIVEELNGRGVSVNFHKEGIVFRAGKGDAMDRLMLTIMGAVAQFERSMILERQREGLAAARAQGRRLGKQSRFSEADVQRMVELRKSGVGPTEIAKQYGITRQGVYKILGKADPKVLHG